ncbi:DUF5776 domain-containing protein [Virgibacillus kekensis]|uniref:DUF5776 domain-containing protein n=1 Tax=Virgibacillus kekensis TaxID=202261 RepID=A0ABV9DES6_9BACI
MTAVLTENGFMTNDAYFQLIFGSKQEEYVYEIARVHAKAITRYFGISYEEPVDSQKYVEVIVDSLWTYNSANWDDHAVVVHKGEVFTVIKDKFYVDGGYMYQIKSGLYITANPNYVRAYTK